MGDGRQSVHDELNIARLTKERDDLAAALAAAEAERDEALAILGSIDDQVFITPEAVAHFRALRARIASRSRGAGS